MSAPPSPPIKSLGAGATFILPDTGSKYNPHVPHLQICLTDPCKDGKILCVSVGSYSEGMDKTCRLRKGDHDYIDHDSTIYYGTARFLPAAETLSRINAGELEWRGLANDKLFRRACQGIENSDFTKPLVESYAQAQWKAMGLKFD